MAPIPRVSGGVIPCTDCRPPHQAGQAGGLLCASLCCGPSNRLLESVATPGPPIRIQRERSTERLEIIWFLCSGICHQIPERTLHYGGRPLPLCARCTGTFTGVLVGFVVLWASGLGRRGRLPTWRQAWPLAALAGWWAVDGLNSFLALVIGYGPLYQPSNALRLASGLGLGVALAGVLAPICRSVFWHDQVERSPLEDYRVEVRMLGAAGIVGIVLLNWRAAPYALWAALVLVAAALTLIAANGALATLLARREGRAHRWQEVMPALAWGTLLTLGETGGLALLRGWLEA